MTYFPYAFEGRIVRHDVGTYRYNVVFLPPAIASELPFDSHPRLRVSGEVDDVPFTGAWQPVRGHWYLMLSKAMMREGQWSLCDPVEVRFRIEDQDSVVVPERLERALARDRTAKEVWQSLTAGTRRGFAHRVASAKTEATAERRVAEVLLALAQPNPNPMKRNKP